MTGTEMVITVLGLGLITGGVICAKAYLQHRSEQKHLDVMSLLTTQETERMKVFANAVKKQEKLGDIYEDAGETYDAIVRGASDADYLEIGGKRINQDVVEGLMRQKRSRSTETQLNGWYRIMKVDSSKPEGFIVEVRSQEDGRVFSAKLEDKWIFRRDTNLDIIKNAEWGKKPVYLRINAKELRGEVTQATILDVEENAA